MDVFTDKLPETPKRSVTRAGVLRVLGVMLFFFLFGLVWHWFTTAEERSLRTLKPGERGQVYQRSLQNFTTLCSDPTPDVSREDRCREQVDFLSRFPECDDACRTLLNDFRRRTGR